MGEDWEVSLRFVEFEVFLRFLSGEGEYVVGYRSLRFSGQVQVEDRNLGIIRIEMGFRVTKLDESIWE